MAVRNPQSLRNCCTVTGSSRPARICRTRCRAEGSESGSAMEESLATQSANAEPVWVSWRGMWTWEAAALCSVDKVNWAPRRACRDWSHPSRAVHWSHAGLGRGEWNWHPFWRDGPQGQPAGRLVGVGANRTTGRRSVKHRSHRPDAAGSTGRG